MGNIYIARQPIFDNEMHIYGYELLYRSNQLNRFDGTDDDVATASLLDDFFLTEFNELVGDTRGFVNFSENLLLDKVPLLLPKEKVVVEILERVEVTDQLIEVCRDLKNKGYSLALDDFILHESDPKYRSLLDLVDIVKIEFDHSTMNQQVALIRQYHHKVKFLAEKVETREEYMQAIGMGYSLFQGYFFSKPLMINAKSIGTVPDNLIMILNELNRPDIEYEAVTEVFKRDVELSYKLLRMVNSAYYGVRHHIDSIHHAVVQLGVQELIRWVNLMIIKGVQNTENAELVRQSLIRGRMLALYALETEQRRHESDYFITGIFSSIDVLLNKDMKDILPKLPLDETVVNTLMGEDTKIQLVLRAVKNLERAEWSQLDEFIEDTGLCRSTFMALYTAAVKWQQSL